MSNEKDLIDNLFSRGKWKNKYNVKWCNLCDCAYILCDKCKNSSCNGGGCEECEQPFNEFTKAKIKIECYLSKEEIQILHKARRIQDFIIETLSESKSEIDFQNLKENGKLSRHDIETFL